MNHLPIPGSTPEQPELTNVEATGQLLDVLEQEAAHPNAVISDKDDFPEEYSPSLVLREHAGPYIEPLPLSRVGDPNNPDYSYLVGLRPDGIGQVIIQTLVNGGVVGAVELILQRDQPTVAFGELHDTWGPKVYGLSDRDIQDGEPVPAEMLTQLGASLQVAFEARRQAQRESTLAGRIGAALMRKFRPQHKGIQAK